MTNAECCEGTCHPAQSHCCKLDGVACAGDFECCDPMACVVDGVTGIGTCQSDMGCGIPDLEGPCGSDSDCCSQDCNKELDHCCLTVDNGCGHGVCFQGEPLDVTCDDGSSDGGNRGMLPVSKPFGDPGCIDDICGDRNFAYCCCDGWDAGCVDRALSSDVCNLTCLEDPNPPMP